MQYEHARARESLLVAKGERLNAVDRQWEREAPELRRINVSEPQIAAREAHHARQKEAIEAHFARQLEELDAEWTKV